MNVLVRVILFCLILSTVTLSEASVRKLIKSSIQPKATAGCQVELINPHLGSDIYAVSCRDFSMLPQASLGTLDSSYDNEVWHLLEDSDKLPVQHDDPERKDQWALDFMNISTPAPDYQDKTRIKVAVIDTGVDYQHEDLAKQIATNQLEIADNEIDDDNNGYVDDIFGWNSIDNTNKPKDFHHHGTHVAGIIGAESNNQLGVAGVSSAAHIIPVRFIGPAGGTTEGAIRAFDYAIARGSKIVNASWGGSSDSPLLKEIIKRCQELGILVIAAAGNETVDNDKVPTYPANFDLDNIISVAAIDLKGNLSWFSNWGILSVDIAAPGESILSTLPNNRYGFLEGTSMAAPQISGVAAQIWSEHPGWNYLQVKEHLIGKCTQGTGLEQAVVCKGYFRF